MSDIAAGSPKEIERAVHDLQARQLELQVQNEELRRARAELVDARDCYIDLFDFAPVGYLTLDSEMTVRKANLTVAKLLGVARASLVDQTLTHFVASESRDDLRNHQAAVLHSKDKQVCELSLRRADGTTFPAQLETIHVAGGVGQVPQCWCVISDITERKQTEARLLWSEERYRSLYEKNLDGVFVVDLDGRFLDANPSALQLAGYSSEELRQRTFMDLCAPDCLAATLAAFRDGMAGQPRDVETALIRKDGSRVELLISGTPMITNGQAIGAFGIARDITERKEAEAALRLSEERLRQSIRVARLGHFEHDHQTNEIYASSSMREIWDWSEEEVVTVAKIISAVHPEDRPGVLTALHRGHDPAGDGLFFCEHRVVRPDGTIRWVSARAQTTFEGEGPRRHLVRTIGALVDMTVAKEAEAQLRELNATLEQRVAERTQALRESQEHLRTIVDTAADGIITLDEHGRIESMNPAALKMFGYTPREILGKDIDRLLIIAEQKLEKGFLEYYLEAPGRQRLGRPQEIRGRRKGGGRIALELILTQFTHGGHRGFVAMVHDMTERKRLERKLVDAGERERQQVGRELHDELGQILHGVHFLAAELQTRLKQQGVVEAAELDRVNRYLNEALETTRSVARGLQPVPPVPEGLMNALREQAARIREVYRVRCRFVCPKPVQVSDPAVATHLFRIAQEAITNAIKHSQCERIIVHLRKVSNRIILGVRDDGHGRFPTPERQRGMGLHLMQFRATAISGSLLVQRQPKVGTEVLCTVESVAKSNQRGGKEVAVKRPATLRRKEGAKR